MKYRFGIIGAGLIAQTHAKALLSLPNTELAGIADIDPERAASFSASFGITAYPSAEALLSDERIDAVCICTPSGFHCENAVAALEHGKHVVLEKPMALNVGDADKIIAACRRNQKQLTVMSQMRFADDIQKVRALAQAGAFGRISMCSLSMKFWRDESYYQASPWRGTKKYDGGGALMNQGIHGVDLLRYLAGNFTVTAAQARTMTHQIEVEDTVNALLSFENGAVGVLEASTCAFPGFDRRIELIGDRGHAILRDTTLESLVIDGKTVPCERNAGMTEAASNPSVSDCTLHARQISGFVDAAADGVPFAPGAEDGKEAIRTIREVYSLAGI